MTNKIYLNFGAGNPVAKWTNLDSSPFFMLPKLFHLLIDLLKLSKRSKQYLSYQYQYYKFSIDSQLPFKNNSVEAIHTSHVLEHLSVEENEHFFTESYRILKKGGVLRIIVPNLENNITLNQFLFSLEKKLLTLPTELKKNAFRAMLEAAHGFPSFHKTLFVEKHISQYFKDKWKVSKKLKYLQSAIPKSLLTCVEQEIRTKDALIFELVKK